MAEDATAVAVATATANDGNSHFAVLNDVGCTIRCKSHKSGQCVPAVALREAFKGRAEVITPDLPMHPKEAVRFIRELIDGEQPDLLIGNSCGAFYAQMVAPVVCIPALLGNPHFKMTEFLKQRVGEHQYKSPRKDGKQNFVIYEALIEKFAEMEAIQLPVAIPTSKTVYGVCLENRTH